MAFLAFKANDPSLKSDCARPSGIAKSDASLVVGTQDGVDYIRYQACQIAGEIRGGRFLAEDAPCTAFGGTGEPAYPHRVYDQVEVDFEAGTIRLTSSDLGPESSGQCNQLDGYIRRPSEEWQPAGAEFWIADAPWNVVSGRFRGGGEISTYLQRRPDRSQHLLGLSCRFPASSGAAGSPAEVTCETPFQGEHAVPDFVPGESEVSEGELSIRGEFRSPERTYDFVFEASSIEREP